MTQLDLPDNVYNWLVDFFSGHTHCTVYRGETSTLKSITASIIQGSGIGLASYVISASDLELLTPGNKLCKFADDTYLIIPAINVASRSAQIDHIEAWALKNNAKPRKRGVAAFQPMPGIPLVTSLKVLSVTLTNDLSASDHVRGVTTNCSQTLNALRVLRAHGMCDLALQTISGRSLLPSYSTRAVLGGASPMRPTGSESTPSCGAAFVAATVRQT
jgi:hypothetical protein